MDKLLGKKVKDIVTGFEGIVMAKIEYLTGCNQYEIKPKVDKDGKSVDSQWIDEHRVEVVDTGIRKEVLDKLEGKKPGGPTPSDSMPSRD